MASSVAASRVGFLCCLVAIVVVALLPADSVSEILSHSMAVSREDVSVGASAGAVVSIGGDYDRLGDVGSPALPYRVVNFLLPDGDEVVSYRVVADGSVTLARETSVQLATALVLEDGRVASPSPMLESFDSQQAFPLEQIRYMGTGYMHGRGIASFAVFPVRIIGGDLVLSSELAIEIETAPRSEPRPDIVRRARHRDGFDDYVRSVLASHVVNPDMGSRYEGGMVRVGAVKGFAPTSYPSLEGSAVDYLIITTDALAGEFQRLADWKTAKGVPAVVRTVEWIEANTKNGVDIQETLRFFIREAYAKWGIKYLLLGGDTDVMPPRFGFSRFVGGGTEVPSDMYFACLDGSWNKDHNERWGQGVYLGVHYDDPDLYPEVYQGRISCSIPACGA